MKEKITKLKERIKKEDQKLFDLISTLKDDIIIQNYGAFVQHLNDLNEESDYTVEFSLENDILDWKYLPKSATAIMGEKANEVKENYLLPLLNDGDYLLNINEINKTKNRKPLLKELLTLAEKWNSPEPKQSLWIYGSNGVGKTHIIKAFLNFISEKDNKVGFLFVPELIATLKNLITNFEGKDIIEDIIDKAKNSSLLVMDDIAAAAFTPWIRDTFLLPIIEFRSANNKPTIYTSNTDIKDFERRISLSRTPAEDKVAAERIKNKIEVVTKEIKI